MALKTKILKLFVSSSSHRASWCFVETI